jgi:hypothetical protein
LENFIETGTGYGLTAVVAAKLFKRVYTIELLPEVYEQQVGELLTMKNVERLCGDSRDLLKDIVNRLDSPSMFYLDAHYNGMGERRSDIECPLLDELEIIFGKPMRTNCIVIDNVGMFVHPHPPHRPEEWPKIGEIGELIRSRCHSSIQIFCDVMLITPVPIFTTL